MPVVFRIAAKFAGRKAPAVPGVVWGQRSRFRLRRVSWCFGCRTKIPQGRHGLGGFHDATLGLAGLNVEKDQHKKLWQTLTFQSALLMMNTAASSVAAVREPPAVERPYAWCTPCPKSAI